MIRRYQMSLNLVGWVNAGGVIPPAAELTLTFREAVCLAFMQMPNAIAVNTLGVYRKDGKNAALYLLDASINVPGVTPTVLEEQLNGTYFGDELGQLDYVPSDVHKIWVRPTAGTFNVPQVTIWYYLDRDIRKVGIL